MVVIDIEDLEIAPKRRGTEQDGRYSKTADDARPARCRLAMTLIEQYRADAAMELIDLAVSVDLLDGLHGTHHDDPLATMTVEALRETFDITRQNIPDPVGLPDRAGADLIPEAVLELGDELLDQSRRGADD